VIFIGLLVILEKETIRKFILNSKKWVQANLCHNWDHSLSYIVRIVVYQDWTISYLKDFSKQSVIFFKRHYVCV
jgi:hypothetical protein